MSIGWPCCLDDYRLSWDPCLVSEPGIHWHPGWHTRTRYSLASWLACLSQVFTGILVVTSEPGIHWHPSCHALARYSRASWLSRLSQVFTGILVVTPEPGIHWHPGCQSEPGIPWHPGCQSEPGIHWHPSCHVLARYSRASWLSSHDQPVHTTS
ncbi:hypothetical protein BsWGS_25000 [Bradybaena similaris]